MRIMAVLAILFSVAAVFADTGPSVPSSKPPIKKPAKAQAADLNDESSEAEWNSEADDVVSQVKKLRLKLAIKTHEYRALQNMLNKNYVAADVEYQAALKLGADVSDPHTLQDFLSVADSHAMAGDRQGAIKEYGKLIDMLKQWLLNQKETSKKDQGIQILARTYGARGVTSMGLGMNKEADAALLKQALEDFDQALQVGHPRPSLMIVEKSMILSRLGHYADAAKLYQEALEKDSKLQNHHGHSYLCKNFADHGLKIGVCN